MIYKQVRFSWMIILIVFIWHTIYVTYGFVYADICFYEISAMFCYRMKQDLQLVHFPCEFAFNNFYVIVIFHFSFIFRMFNSWKTLKILRTYKRNFSGNRGWSPKIFSTLSLLYCVFRLLIGFYYFVVHLWVSNILHLDWLRVQSHGKFQALIFLLLFLNA